MKGQAHATVHLLCIVNDKSGPIDNPTWYKTLDCEGCLQRKTLENYSCIDGRPGASNATWHACCIRVVWWNSGVEYAWFGHRKEWSMFDEAGGRRQECYIQQTYHTISDQIFSSQTHIVVSCWANVFQLLNVCVRFVNVWNMNCVSPS